MSSTLDTVGFDPAVMTGNFQVFNYTVVISSARQLGVKSNPGRTALTLFQAFGPVPVANARTTWGSPGPNTAWRLLTELPRVIKWVDYGAMVGWDWYFNGDGFPWTLGVWEVIYRAKTAKNECVQRNDRYNGGSRDGDTKIGPKANRVRSVI